MHPRPTERQLVWGRIAIIATVVAWLVYLASTVLGEALDPYLDHRSVLEMLAYVTVLSLLTFSALMYLVARQGAMHRFSRHHRRARADLDRHAFRSPSAVTVLVPSYREEPDVVRMTLWSAALQEAGTLRVVLLLDDPPHASDPAEIRRQIATRAVVDEITSALAGPHRRYCATLKKLMDADRLDTPLLNRLHADQSSAAQWLRQRATDEAVHDHITAFFADHVLDAGAHDLQVVADALSDALADPQPTPGLSLERAREMQSRLVRLFSVEMSIFERKQHANVPHESNKAMNLNAYLGLMGRHYSVTEQHGMRYLTETSGPVPGGLSVPRPDHVLTLDADSLILPEYCLRLVHELEAPGHERVAVAQTPYSSFRGAPTRLERLAGATTDIQHVLHQGFTHHDATFWVGANAVIRRDALESICQEETVGSTVVRRYVLDRTPIEDTESSIDLVAAGWSLLNYPERLSYSATPSDFGSLVVQRRRWANGGLLIMGKLFSVARANNRAGSPLPLTTLALRANYLSSISWACFGLFFLLFYPVESAMLSPIVALTALPYALAMAADLKHLGYRRRDVVGIYGFNLVLLPVNLAGVLKSLEQGVTGRKIDFARTPKVKDRTAAPGLFVVAPLVIIGVCASAAWHQWNRDAPFTALFAGANGLLALWAYTSLLGLRAPLADAVGAVVRWTIVTPAPAPAEAVTPPPPDWRTVLHAGTTDTTAVDPLPVPLLTGVTTTRVVAAPEHTSTPSPTGAAS